MPIANYVLAGAYASQGDAERAAQFEAQADRATPNNAAFHWMLGLRLKNLKFDELAEKRFSRAVELDQKFATKPRT
jgi:hypothetical protein